MTLTRMIPWSHCWSDLRILEQATWSAINTRMILTALKHCMAHNTYFWDMTPWRSVPTFRRNVLPTSSHLYTETVCFSETSVRTYQATRRHILQGSNLHTHSRETWCLNANLLEEGIGKWSQNHTACLILSRDWVTIDGVWIVIGFIDHSQIVTTSNYSAIAKSHTQRFTTARTKSSQSAVSSPVVAW
jgi:hypothetical protein